jgi:hypothetical protein
VDPFYPTTYKGADLVTEKVDWCLAHPNHAGMFHYHAPSTCIADKNIANQKKGPMTDDVKTFITDTYKQKMNRRAVLGISKDGRVIYTPMHNGGEIYNACHLDVCNGV